MHRQFNKILNIFKHIATIEENLFFLHVVDGYYILIQIDVIVYLHLFEYKEEVQLFVYLYK